MGDYKSNESPMNRSSEILNGDVQIMYAREYGKNRVL